MLCEHDKIYLPQPKARSMHNEEIWQALLLRSVLLFLDHEVLSFYCAAYIVQMDKYKIRSSHHILFEKFQMD